MWEDCIADADCAIHAQWSVVDFDAWDVCATHYLDMYELIIPKLVDGEPPFDTWTVWWDDEGDYVDELPRGVPKT